MAICEKCGGFVKERGFDLNNDNGITLCKKCYEDSLGLIE